ncbi:MAG: hypothetical protein SNJ61_11880, partial [Fimbriimonadaceae bacterium]
MEPDEEEDRHGAADVQAFDPLAGEKTPSTAVGPEEHGPGAERTSEERRAANPIVEEPEREGADVATRPGPEAERSGPGVDHGADGGEEPEPTQRVADFGQAVAAALGRRHGHFGKHDRRGRGRHGR